MCMVLPGVIEHVVNAGDGIHVPEDTVLGELGNIARQVGEETDPLAMAMAVYMLGFHTYRGFRDCMREKDVPEDAILKRLYEYAKQP